MKNIWKNYNYTIVLLLMCSIFLLFIANQNNEINTDEYITIKIESGDTLLQIAEEFSDLSGLKQEKFIVWIEKYNDLSRNEIVSGSNLLIPVKQSKFEQSWLAIAKLK